LYGTAKQAETELSMAVKFRDYYEVLGVPKSAKEDEIRTAYRKLARKYHPDVNPGDKEAEESFKEINEAYQVLSDPQKRKKYDQLGQNWKAGQDFTPPPGWEPAWTDFGSRTFGGAEGAGGFSDFFEMLFGGRRPRRPGAGFTTPGRDIEAEIPLSLEEAHRGSTRAITLQIGETCPECKGTGTIARRICPTCHGTGVARRPKTLEVTIPKGVREGAVIRLQGQGEPGSGGPPGDLLLRVNLQPHRLFSLVGEYDLQVEVPLAPWEAVLGASVLVPTLDRNVQMKIPAGARAGQRLRLRGQGLNKRGGGRGDLYAKLKIVVPANPTPKERELFQRLAAESPFNPRAEMAGSTQ
jgi:curved DNA-binding protein